MLKIATAMPLLLALLAGCNFAPEYRRPAVSVSAVFPETTGQADNTAATIAWKDYFLDPHLRRRLEAAVSRNADLDQALARIEQARARFRIQDSRRLPEGAGSASALRQRFPAGAAGIAGPGAEASTLDQFGVGVAITGFELDLWGRLKNQSDAARAEYLATVEGARAFRIALIAQTAQTWFDLRAGRARIALAERTIANREEGAKIARARLNAGVTSTIDYDQAVTLLTQARAEHAELQRTTAQAGNLLDVLTGGPMTGADAGGRPLEGEAQVQPVAAGLPSELLANRPDILAAELRLRGANANVGAAKAAFFPTVSLTGTFGFAATALTDLFTGGAKSWQVGGDVGLPIFDWGRRKADLRLARAQADELVASYRKTVQDGFREVADALAARRWYQEQIAVQRQALMAQRRLATAARKRYANGIAPYLQVLDAERSLFATEQDLVRLRATALQNAVSLWAALGGGALAVPPGDRTEAAFTASVARAASGAAR